jgi:hypothetical protein
MQASMLQSKWYHKPHVTTKSWKEAVVMVEGLAKWQEKVCMYGIGLDTAISLYCGFYRTVSTSVATRSDTYQYCDNHTLTTDTE